MLNLDEIEVLKICKAFDGFIGSRTVILKKNEVTKHDESQVLMQLK